MANFIEAKRKKIQRNKMRKLYFCRCIFKQIYWVFCQKRIYTIKMTRIQYLCFRLGQIFQRYLLRQYLTCDYSTIILKKCRGILTFKMTIIEDNVVQQSEKTLLGFIKNRILRIQFHKTISHWFNSLLHVQFRMKAQREYNFVRMAKLNRYYEHEMHIWKYQLG